jgi:hypothetical protein
MAFCIAASASGQLRTRRTVDIRSLLLNVPVRWCAVYGEWHDNGIRFLANEVSQNAKAVADQLVRLLPLFAVNLTFSLASSFTKPFMGQSLAEPSSAC